VSRKKPGERRTQVDVVHLVNGTTQNASFTADDAVMEMRGGEGYLTLTGGRDDRGPVQYAFFAHAEVMILRPIEEKS